MSTDRLQHEYRTEKRAVIKNLHIITTLDSLSYGLMYRFINANICQKMGANQIHVGLLTIGLFVGDLISSDVTKILTLGYNKRMRLLFTLTMTLVTILMIGTPVTPNNYWFVMLVRIFFSSINQTQAIVLSLLASKGRRFGRKLNENQLTKYNILSKSGLIIGPIFAGYLYGTSDGFMKICCLSALLTLANIVLLTRTPMQDQKEVKDLSVNLTGKARAVLKDNINNLIKCNLRNNWDLLLIRYLFVGSCFVFMSKVRKIMVNHYAVNDPVSAGYTISFVTFLDFIFTYYASSGNEVKVLHLAFILELTLLLATILMILAMWMPTFQLFVLMSIPVIFIRHVVNYMWPGLFCERNNVALCNLDYVAGLFPFLTVPVIFGVSYEMFGPKVLTILTCVPLVVCWSVAGLRRKELKTKKD